MYKGPLDKDNQWVWGGAECGKWQWVGWGTVMGGQWGQL